MQFARQGHDTRKKSGLGICFILMPFRPDLDELYAQSIKPSVERSGVLQCLRADEIYGPRPIMTDIWSSIRRSKLVIADLTGRNPNVLYELGLAHAIQKPVILLSQNIDDVPFDLKHVRVIIYNNTEQGRKQLQARLHETLHAVLKAMDDKSFVRQYTILEPHEELKPPVGKSLGRLLRSLKSKDPNETLKALTKIKGTYKHSKKKCDPRILAAVLPHLQSSFSEVQFAAIQAIGTAGDRVHAPDLHSFLSVDNPVLAEASIRALGELRDRSAVPQLVSMFDNPTYQMCRGEILAALGKIGGEEAISFLSRIATDDQADLNERKAAIWNLGRRYEYQATDILLGVDVGSLDVSLRCELAEALAGVEPLYEPPQLKRMETQLKRLLSDKSPEVRGRALAAWCLNSFKPFEGRLDRSFLWDQLRNESEDVLWNFTIGLALYKTPFAPEETKCLVELGEKHSMITNDVVYYLKNIGDNSASDFMTRAYTGDEENQLWVLDYLSRVPSTDAVELLRSEIQHGEDPSRISLAAIALSKIGVEDTTDLLLQKVFDSYLWVQVKAREHLVERLRYEKSVEKQQVLRQALKKLPKQ